MTWAELLEKGAPAGLIALGWIIDRVRMWRSGKADVVAKLLDNQTALQTSVNELQAANLELNRQVARLTRALILNGIDPESGIKIGEVR